MVKLSYTDIALYSLADPTRREILRSLSISSFNVTDLYKKICRIKFSVGDEENFIVKPQPKMSLPALSKHLRVLETARLITRHQIGREHKFFLTKYAQFWIKELDNFDKFLEAIDK